MRHRSSWHRGKGEKPGQKRTEPTGDGGPGASEGGGVNGKRHDGSLLAKCQCECKAVQVARERGLDIYLRATANPFKITPLSCEFEISHGPTPRDV